MRPLRTVWLIALFSLANLSAIYRPPSVCRAPIGMPGQVEQGFYATGAQAELGTSIPFDDYWQLVRDTRQAIGQMKTKPAGTIRQELDALAARWRQVTTVEEADHSLIQIDPSYLAAELQQDPPELKRLENELDALLNAHEKYPSKVFTLADVAPLKEILRRPEFQWQAQPVSRAPNLLDKIFNWIENFRDRVLNTMFRVGRTPLIIAAVIIFLLSVFFISRGLSRSLVREADLGTEEAADDKLLTSKGAFKRAENLSLQGDYRNAIRYLYLSSLLVLDEQGLMRYDRSRTNREYLRSVASKPELAKPLRDVIDVFDRVWYGFEGVDEETYRSYVERVDELREKKE